MENVFLGLGSNLGNREVNLLKSLLLIESETGNITDVSSLYSTAPWGNKALLPFLNMVCCISTAFSPVEILKKVEAIERTLGRQHGKGNLTDRLIDIDILFFGSKIIREKHLQIPHPKLHERNFVLVPLAEINSQVIHPVFGVSAEQMLKNSSDSLSVIKYRDRTTVKSDFDQLFSKFSV